MGHLISDDHSWVMKYLWFVSKTRFWIFRNSLKYALSVGITFFINIVKSIFFKNRSFLHLPYRHRIDWTCQCGKYSSGFTHFNAFMMGFIGFWFLSELMQEAQMFYGIVNSKAWLYCNNQEQHNQKAKQSPSKW